MGSFKLFHHIQFHHNRGEYMSADLKNGGIFQIFLAPKGNKETV